MLTQPLCQNKGIEAISYQVPPYLLMSTFGTVLGGADGTEESGLVRRNPPEPKSAMSGINFLNIRKLYSEKKFGQTYIVKI